MKVITFFLSLVFILGIVLRQGVLPPSLHWVGHLPGDLVIRKEGLVFFFPLVTSLIVSFLVLLILNILRSFLK